MSEVIEKIGEPANISEEKSYTRLYYDGFYFGFDGNVADNPFLCAIFITDSDIKMLRNGVTVGSSLDKIENTYKFARVMKNTSFQEGGYILSNDDHEVADGGGIWICYKYDTNNIITEISAANGF